MADHELSGWERFFSELSSFLADINRQRGMSLYMLNLAPYIIIRQGSVDSNFLVVGWLKKKNNNKVWPRPLPHDQKKKKKTTDFMPICQGLL